MSTSPQPDTLSLVLLGTIAALSLLQGLVLLGAAWSAFRAARRMEAMAGRLGGVLQPSVLELSRAARDAAEVSDLMVAQAHRLDVLVTETVEKVERVQSAFQRLLPVAGRVAAAASVLRVLRSGVRAIRRLRR
ncbi:MAG TPA: hypothetical protein VMT87_10295 [Vicinamibacteria bacterium]|nr:hypothetical protein [Vicinamibacteria bacterium]